MKGTTKKWWLPAVIAAALLGCGDGVLADGDDVLYFNPWNAGEVTPRTVEDREPVSSPQDASNYDEVVQGFTEQSTTLLERSDVNDVLAPIEQSFMLSGQYLDLVDLYRAHYERRGTDSVAAPALAWTYLQIGNEPALAEVTSALIDEQPDDPLTWVIVGNTHLRDADTSISSARRALEAFERIFELDPQFSGFKGAEPQLIQQQIEALQMRVPDDPEQELAALEEMEEEAAAPMHHTDGEAPPAVEVEDPEEIEEIEETEPEEPEEIEELEEPEEIEAPAEADEIDEPVDDVQAIHHVLLGQQAFQRGSAHYSEAEQHFRSALALDPDNMDAELGMLRLAERLDGPDERLVEAVDRLTDRDLSAQQALDLGLFCLRRLNDRDRATSLLKRVKEKDPSLARRVDVDSLLAH